MSAHTHAADAPGTLNYLHLYADENGVSRFKEASLPFSRSPSGPELLALANKEGASFLRLAAGEFEDWHIAPRRWFLIVVQGISEVGTSDGNVRRLTPGTVVLMDDTTGKGHTTRAVGPEDHIALVVPIDEVP